MPITGAQQRAKDLKSRFIVFQSFQFVIVFSMAQLLLNYFVGGVLIKMVFGVERKYPLSYFSKHLLSPKFMWTFDDFRVCPVYWMLWSYAKSTLGAKSSAIRSGKVAKCYLLSVCSGCYVPHIYTEWPQLVVPHLNLSSVACLPGNITSELVQC